MSSRTTTPPAVGQRVKRVGSTESTQSIAILGPDARQDFTASGIGSGIDSGAGLSFSGIETAEPLYDVYNCASVLLKCSKHDTYALSEVKSKAKKGKGPTFPTVYVTNKSSFTHSITSKLKALLSHDRSERGYVDFTDVQPLQKIRIQLPSCNKYVIRAIYRTSIPKESPFCCKDVDNKSMQWLDLGQMISKIDTIWGPEPVIMAHFLTATKLAPLFLVEKSVKALNHYLPREAPTNDYERLLKIVGYTERDIARLLSEFIQHTWPERFMSQKALISYLKRSKWLLKDVPFDETAIFRAFSMERLPYIQFHEFLLGLAASEPELGHQGVAATVRNRYIIRYYDVHGNDVVEKNEIRKLVKDSLAALAEKVNDEILAHNVETLYSADGSKLRDILSKNKLPGARMLFRGLRSFIKCSDLVEPIVYDAISPSFDPRPGKQKDTEDQKCDKCTEKRYMIAPAKVRLTEKGKGGDGGRIVDKETLDYPDNKNMDSKKKERFDHNTDDKSLERVILSLMPNCETFLKQVDVADKIMLLCQKALPLLEAEGSLIELTSPCYVFGAVAGSANHLHEISQIMFPRIPTFELESFLFLGNFIAGKDARGLQCLLFMLAHKCLCPHRFLILRGSAEMKQRNQLQAQLKKYIAAENTCKRVCKELFRVLDHMPIAAVINNDVLCISSGIPYSAERLSDIADADTSDALRNRITGEIFSPDLKKDSEIENTLSKLNVSHAIRSSLTQTSDNGFTRRLIGKVVTLSPSSSKRPPAFVSVNDGKIVQVNIQP